MNPLELPQAPNKNEINSNPGIDEVLNKIAEEQKNKTAETDLYSAIMDDPDLKGILEEVKDIQNKETPQETSKRLKAFEKKESDKRLEEIKMELYGSKKEKGKKAA